MKDRDFMAEALSLAGRGKGRVLPNPMVGALVVRDGRVIGRGWHQNYGGEHAEVMAIRDASRTDGCRNGVLFCNLEPCCFDSEHKHNPPCTGEIIEAGLKKVCIARLDPNPHVMGRAVEILRKAGIVVETGLLEQEAAELNRIYETIVIRRRPYVHLKVALTLDGYMAAFDGKSNWISCKDSRSRVMDMRADYEAVLVGAGTVRADRPRLTVRGRVLTGKQPFRVVLKGFQAMPDDWPKLSDNGGEVLIFEPGGMGNRVELKLVLDDLLKCGVYSILVEGGNRVFTSFITNGLWDRMTVFQSPDLLGGGLHFFEDLQGRKINQKLTLYNRKNRWSGRDVEVRGDREFYPCLQV